jgi:hypothetical protein
MTYNSEITYRFSILAPVNGYYNYAYIPADKLNLILTDNFA